MYKPLADEIRPHSLDDVVGQKHILGERGLLRRIVESGSIPNMIFYGPSGTGKTTVARIIAEKTNRTLRKLNATTAGLADIKEIIAELDTLLTPGGVLLYLDEIQYFNKKQQQSLLEFIEDGRITLIASTTENPYFCVFGAILSRSTVFEFKPVTPKEAEPAVMRAFSILAEREGKTPELEPGVVQRISQSCGGDVRKALNAVELLFSAARTDGDKLVISLDDAKTVTQRSAMRYDRDGDEHYDALSALMKSLRGSDADAALPFADVTAQRGYIAIAYEIGMTTGATETTFEPDGTATREQAAAMLVRVYEKYHAPTTWKHAFYALSSYSQLEQAKQFDAVSFGWSHMTYSAEEGAKLSTVKDDSSGFYIPVGYADVVPALREAGVELKLNVFMANAPLRTMLADESSRAAAVTEIMAELGRVYPDLGYNPYSGVTIDFEGLRAADKESFNAFMMELSAALHAEGKTLYAAVMPAVYGDAYFDGYDFKTLGTLCDRVILMAHDYAASDLTGFLNSRYYRNHPCAPLYKVYYAVRTAAREMDDPAKLTLAVSMDARAWQTDADGLLTAVRSTHPLQTTVYKRLCQSDTVMGWSDTARSPWCTYSTEGGQHIFLWYEDARSTAEKLSCAKLVGVTSVSVWRLGLIPDYADEGLHYDVMSVL